MAYQHDSLANGRWSEFSLIEQLGNVGSEVSRAVKAGENEERRWSSLVRAFELLDLTIADERWRYRLKELVRAREVLADAALNGIEYGSTLEDLDKYFFQFASAARNGY